MGLAGVLVLAVALIFGIPWIQLALNTVSTDDAFVNGHVTFVAARVSGQIARVLVDDNNHVHKGDLLAQLDKEPLEDAVAEKRAAVDIAKADLRAAEASVRGIEAQARSLRWKLQYAIADVDNRVALLHARIAALDKSKAQLNLAQLEFSRAEQLLPQASISREQYDQRQAALSEARFGGIMRDFFRHDRVGASLRGAFYPEIAAIWGLAFAMFLQWEGERLQPDEVRWGVIVTITGVFLTRVMALIRRLKGWTYI